MIRKSALCTCLLLGAAMAAMGQTMMENQDKFQSVDPGIRIAACTALIEVRVLISTEKLSVIYNNRGSAYSSKHDYDLAIQDFTEAIRLTPNTA